MQSCGGRVDADGGLADDRSASTALAAGLQLFTHVTGTGENLVLDIADR